MGITLRQARERFGELEPSERCPHARAWGRCLACANVKAAAAAPEHLTLDPRCAVRTVFDTVNSGFAGRCPVCAAVSAPVAAPSGWEVVTPYGSIPAATLAEVKAKAVEAAQVLGVRSLPVRRLGRAA